MFVANSSEEKEDYTQDELIQMLKEGHKKGQHCFVLIYLVGCGPCNMTKPGWKKVAREYNYHDDNKGIVMVHIDQTNLDKINPIVGNYNISGFPTMLYVHKNKVIPYENSNIKNKNRTAESFKEWINSYLGNGNSQSNSHSTRSSSRSKSNNKLNFMSEFMSNNKSRSSSKSHSNSRNTRKKTQM